jgi:hypothetical protein
MISSGGGRSPVWSRNGRELLFQEGPGGRIMAAGYSVKGDTFVPDKPRVWSETRVLDLNLASVWDIAPDGKRVAAMLPAEEEAQKPISHVTLLLNLFDELRRRAPADKK